LNLLLYLNEEWQESWGGVLELHVDPWNPARDRTKRVLPLLNRCVLFATSEKSWHGFTALKLDGKRISRRSFALYLYTKKQDAGARFIPHDLTVFVDRPLPPQIRPGHTLAEEDVRALERLITRRDMKLKHLYDRAIQLSNDVEILTERYKRGR
jgi:hypothetical protein